MKFLSLLRVTSMVAFVVLAGAPSFIAQGTTPTDTRMVKLDIAVHGARRHVSNTRGMPFGGAAVMVGMGRNQRAHVFTATSCGTLVPGSIEKIDAKKEAAALGAGVTGFIPNTGRHWTMDEIDLHVGKVVDFQGVKMCWVGDMTGEEVRAHFAAPYVIGKILRNTEWIYKAGKPVHLLRDPEGLVWVMQEYTKEVDPTLTIDNLDTVGSKLKNLPKGWTFETTVLTKDLSLDTRRSGLWASIIRDELGNTYEGTGFDDLASYVPGAGHQKPTAAAAGSRVPHSQVPKGKQTALGLYVNATQAYEMWKAAPDKVKVIDVRTPEEFAFVGHPEMAWNIPLAFVTYQRKDDRFEYGHKVNTAFVAQVREIAQPTDVLLVTCRSGGRGAMAVNQLAAAGFTNAYNIVDGVEGDLVQDPESVFNGKRMKNGWKNSAPWVYAIDPEKVILAGGAR